MMATAYNPVLKIAQVNQYMTQVMSTGDDYPGTGNSYIEVIQSLQNASYDEDGSGGWEGA